MIKEVVSTVSLTSKDIFEHFQGRPYKKERWHFMSFGSALAVKNFDESFSELYVEGGVNDRVHSTIDITQPGEGTVQGLRDVAFFTVLVQDMGNEEWQPTNNEDPYKQEKQRLISSIENSREIQWVTI